jgi:hypothetical protein
LSSSRSSDDTASVAEEDVNYDGTVATLTRGGAEAGRDRRSGENTMVERMCTVIGTRKGGREKGGGEAASREVKSRVM